jgi:hypothetical protein
MFQAYMPMCTSHSPKDTAYRVPATAFLLLLSGGFGIALTYRDRLDVLAAEVEDRVLELLAHDPLEDRLALEQLHLAMRLQSLDLVETLPGIRLEVLRDPHHGIEIAQAHQLLGRD